ncbi:MAG: 3'-5' exonuclease, partial [Mucinivorans sp.]
PLALLQVSTPEVSLLFRVQKVKLTPRIIAILQDKNVLKIGAALRDDIKALQKTQPFTPAGFVDLQTIIPRWGIEEKSVRKMAAIVLGFKVSKAQRLSNWEAVRLTTAQQAYAATDAWVCLRIYQVLKTNKEIV